MVSEQQLVQGSGEQLLTPGRERVLSGEPGLVKESE